MGTSLPDALQSHGQRLNQCVVMTDELDSVLEALRHSCNNLSQMNGLVAAAIRTLAALNDELTRLDEESCELTEMARE